MAITTARLRQQVAQKKRMVDLYRRNGATNASHACQREVEKLEVQIAARESKGALMDWRKQPDAMLRKVAERRVVDGIRFTVHRGPNGSTVDAPCSCFGHPLRTHSTFDCPWLAKRRKRT